MCNLTLSNLHFTSDKIVASTILPIFAAVTVGGNLLVIVAICVKHYLRTSTNAMVASLAVADLIVGIIVMPPNIVQEVLGVWIFNKVFCDLWRAFDVLASTSSIWNLCLLSIDRYLGVKDAFLYPLKVTPFRTFIAISAVWISSFIIAFPAAIWWDKPSNIEASVVGNGTSCGLCEFGQDVAYNTFSSFVSFYIPMFVMLFAYYHVFRAAVNYRKSLSEGRIRLKSRGTLRVHRGSRAFTSINEVDHTRRKFTINLPQLKVNDNFNSPDGPTPSEKDCGFVDSMADLTLRRKPVLRFSDDEIVGSKAVFRGRVVSKFSRFFVEQRAARTLGIVVGCFVACWLPFFVLNVLYGSCHHCIKNVELVMTSVTWLGHCNSFFNPLIYAFFNDHFQRAFRTILSCKTLRRTSSSLKSPTDIYP